MYRSNCFGASQWCRWQSVEKYAISRCQMCFLNNAVWIDYGRQFLVPFENWIVISIHCDLVVVRFLPSPLIFQMQSNQTQWRRKHSELHSESGGTLKIIETFDIFAIHSNAPFKRFECELLDFPHTHTHTTTTTTEEKKNRTSTNPSIIIVASRLLCRYYLDIIK